MRPSPPPIVALLALVGALALAGCPPKKPRTDEIEPVSTTTVDGWRYDYYRNRSYPCSISGYQTLLIGTRIGSSAIEPAPLWVKMHGGGVGWFDEAGQPKPTAGNKVEESQSKLLGFVDRSLMRDVMDAPAGFRVLLVSMCNHDVYAGGGGLDPYNPNLEPDGTPVTVNGLEATKAAIQFAQALYPTTDYFLHGTSAGSAGTFHVGWSLQRQGIPPAGIVADSGIVNDLFETAQNAQGGPCARGEDAIALIGLRWDPLVAAPANQPDLLVSGGRLTVPVAHVWNQGDRNTCSDAPMDCLLRDGTVLPDVWSASCIHEPMRLAIDARGPESRSFNLGVCVDDETTPAPCDVHVVTTQKLLVNIDPSLPADYVAVILDWVTERLAND